MTKSNDGKNENDILQNHFTAYLLVALRNRKTQYLRQKDQRQCVELPFDDVDYQETFSITHDLMEGLSILDQIEDRHLQAFLQRANRRDRSILLAKVLGDFTLAEIAEVLDIGFYATTSAYYRILYKARKELGGHGDEFP